MPTKNISPDAFEPMDCRPGPSKYPSKSAEAITPDYLKGKTAAPKKASVVRQPSLYAEALQFATEAHAGQVRKGTSIPYISHPLAVSALVFEHGGDDEQAIAGLLHDVVEDCEVSLDTIRIRFGERVARIVEGCTDGVADELGRKPPWKARKEAYLAHLRAADLDVLLVSVCDKLHNARAIESDKLSLGEAIFDRFTASAADTRWYYWTLHGAFVARLGETHTAVRDLRMVLNRAF
jgi:(p)ppGpp synthase/HD superfamily hydrolase